MKIVIARLRSRVNYTRPLEHIMDTFFECLRQFQSQHPEHEYLYYNFAFGGKPKRDLNAIKLADVVIIPTENEFHAWVPNYLHPMNLAKANAFIDEMKPHLDGKTVILLSCDRADTVELFRTKTLSGATPANILCIDEDDFPIGVTALKTTFINEWYRENYLSHWSVERHKDFIYWGTEKRKLPGGGVSGDVRHLILKAISKSGLECDWIGRFANIKRDSPMLPSAEILPRLSNANATLCFNWLNPQAITARYHEAIASMCVPLVWDNYDSTDRLGILDWQRCRTADEVISKVRELRSVSFRASVVKTIEDRYYPRVPTQEKIFARFDELLTQKLAIADQAA